MPASSQITSELISFDRPAQKLKFKSTSFLKLRQSATRYSKQCTTSMLTSSKVTWMTREWGKFNNRLRSSPISQAEWKVQKLLNLYIILVKSCKNLDKWVSQCNISWIAGKFVEKFSIIFFATPTRLYAIFTGSLDTNSLIFYLSRDIDLKKLCDRFFGRFHAAWTSAVAMWFPLIVMTTIFILPDFLKKKLITRLKKVHWENIFYIISCTLDLSWAVREDKAEKII